MARLQSLQMQHQMLTRQCPSLPLTVLATECRTFQLPGTVTRSRRRSAPKLKSGCTTCKERHIRCDEGRPGCKRCKKLGRECGGYTDLPPKTARSRRRRTVARASEAISATRESRQGSDIPSTTTESATPKSPPALNTCKPINHLSYIRDDSDCSAVVPESSTPASRPASTVPDSAGPTQCSEEYYLDYLRGDGAAMLSGPDDAHFWANLLSTLSRTEPSIRYATIALSSMHSHYTSSDVPTHSDRAAPDKPEVTLTYYNAAISALNDATLDGCCTFATSLMCCVLFTALETLQGNDVAVANHARSGQEVVVQWKKERQTRRQHVASSADYNDDCLIEQHLAPCVEQVVALTSCFQLHGMGGVQEPPGSTEYRHTPLSYGSLVEAGHALLSIRNAAATSVRPDTGPKYSSARSYSNVSRIHSLQVRLCSWKVAYNGLHRLLEAALDTDLTQAALADMLATIFYAIFTWLSTALAPDQKASHENLNTFRAIMDIAPCKTDGLTSGRVWDESAMQQLVFTAFLCRDPQIKGRALQYLRRSLTGESSTVPVLTSHAPEWMDVRQIGANLELPALERFLLELEHQQAVVAGITGREAYSSPHQALNDDSTRDSIYPTEALTDSSIQGFDTTKVGNHEGGPVA